MSVFRVLLLVIAMVQVTAASAQALPPAQSVVYVGTEVAKSDSWPALSLAGYQWQAGGTTEISAYLGPRWDFLEDRLGLELKIGEKLNHLAQLDRLSPKQRRK